MIAGALCHDWQRSVLCGDKSVVTAAPVLLLPGDIQYTWYKYPFVEFFSKKLNVKQELEVRKKEKIGERNLEQEVDWRRLKKFREI